jgi:hypothetical protein
MLFVKCCLDLILKAMSTIQAIYNLASHGNMSEIPQQHLANAICLLINLRAGLLEPPLSSLAKWLQQLLLAIRLMRGVSSDPDGRHWRQGQLRPLYLQKALSSLANVRSVQVTSLGKGKG